MNRLRGIAPALLTPFDKNGEIDLSALAAHCDFLIGAGVHAIYTLGTTGEVFLLTQDERKKVTEFVLQHVAGRIPVFVHVGAMPTAVACELAQHAQEMGAAGIGAVTPYYFNVDQRGLAAYYQAIAQSVSSDYPVYLYNLPGCTTNDLLPETVRELAQIPNIVGIKNSMGDLDRLNRLIEVTPPEFDVIQGADTMLFPGLLSGAKGSVSGNANVFPEIFVALYDAVLKRDHDKAKMCHRLIRALARVLKNGADIAYFKQALVIRGFKKTYTRAPLLQVPDQEAELLREQIEKLLPEVQELVG